MRLLVILLCLFTAFSTAKITFTLQRAANPTPDQADAYKRIHAAVSKAVARYNRLAKRPNKKLTIQYVPSVKTADGSTNGNIRFGSNRGFMNERTALHEISHTLGIGHTRTFKNRCKSNNWPHATPLLRSWNGKKAKINCGGGHIWPYGLNFDKEMSEKNADRHCKLIDAMLADGLAR